MSQEAAREDPAPNASMIKAQLKADEYRAKAHAAAAMAASCVLDRVRERHEVAATMWGDLADAAERQALDAAARRAQASAATAPGGDAAHSHQFAAAARTA